LPLYLHQKGVNLHLWCKYTPVSVFLHQVGVLSLASVFTPKRCIFTLVG
jgi:hypothetical protein